MIAPCVGASNSIPLLPEALGKVGAIIAFIMPERLAQTDSAMPVKELVGSGAIRCKATSWCQARVSSITFRRLCAEAGWHGEHARRAEDREFDRVEWQSCPIPPQRPRPAAAARLTGGPADRRSSPDPARQQGVKGRASGQCGCRRCCASITRCRHSIRGYRPCHVSAVSQRDFMSAIGGDDSSLGTTRSLLRARLEYGERGKDEALNGPA